MMPPPQRWSLEQNDRRLTIWPDSGLTAFSETRAAATGLHSHPVWKVIWCPDGEVTVYDRPGAVILSGQTVVVPPQLWHRAASSAAYSAAFIEPRAHESTATTPFAVDLAAPDLTAPVVPAEFLAQFTAVITERLGPRKHIDPRLPPALKELHDCRKLAQLAADVGVSPVRLRALIRDQLGVPLVRLRRWHRMQHAIMASSQSSWAEAAWRSGFSDQAHLTRTCASLLGRTPSSVRHTSNDQRSR